jgi:hypothetical protein
MPNSIKYNLSAQTLALKDGNFWIGTGDVSKATTAITDYWNGITPPTGGYTIYLNKATQGPSIYVAANDNELIFLTNRIGFQYFTTVNQCLNWYLTQSDKMVLNKNYESIVTNGLIFNLDAGFVSSYPRNNNTWYNISTSAVTTESTLVNGSTFSSFAGGCIEFDGINDFCSTSVSRTFTSMTIQVWFYGDGNQPSEYSGLVANRTSVSDATGLLLNNFSNRQLGYSWNGAFNTYSWSSGLSLDYYGWHFLSLTVTPTLATAFLNGMTSSNAVSGANSHSAASITSLAIGKDYLTERHVFGKISTVYIYDRALSNEEVLQNYNSTLDRYSSFPKIESYKVWVNCGTDLSGALTTFNVYVTQSSYFTIGNTVYTNALLTAAFSNRTFTVVDLYSVSDVDFTYTGVVTNSLGVITAINQPIGGCLYIDPGGD